MCNNNTDNNELQQIQAERADIEKKLQEARSEKKVDDRYIESLEHRIKQLDKLAELVDPVIRAEALDIMQNRDPVEYILGVYNGLHVGDVQIGKVLLLSIANQSVLNSEGLQPKLSGASGKGKTHAAKAMCHLVPEGYKLQGTISPKTLYYLHDLQPGTIIFSDDVKLDLALEDTLKRTMSNFQKETVHRTVRHQLMIPERTVFWMTSVHSKFSEELVNRLYDLDVDDSADQDEAVVRAQLKRAKYGEIALLDSNDVKVCRSIIHELKRQLFEVLVPFSESIIWKNSRDRRNLPRFLDLIKGFAALRFMQRSKLSDNEILATLQDFQDAKALFDSKGELVDLSPEAFQPALQI